MEVGYAMLEVELEHLRIWRSPWVGLPYFKLVVDHRAILYKKKDRM